ncbi:hypothetical protein B566_EDAN006402 [Ephemera danica]|nr:hypothetical protein B566_EDAN006402 [Ephemera danica]
MQQEILKSWPYANNLRAYNECSEFLKDIRMVLINFSAHKFVYIMYKLIEHCNVCIGTELLTFFTVSLFLLIDNDEIINTLVLSCKHSVYIFSATLLCGNTSWYITSCCILMRKIELSHFVINSFG